MDDGTCFPIGVRWNPKTKRYQSLDGRTNNFWVNRPRNHLEVAIEVSSTAKEIGKPARKMDLKAVGAYLRAIPWRLFWA